MMVLCLGFVVCGGLSSVYDVFPGCTLSLHLLSIIHKLTLSPLLTTTVQYANSLDSDETPSKLGVSPDPSCLTLRQHFQQL